MKIFVVFLNGPVGNSCGKVIRISYCPPLWGGVRLSQVWAVLGGHALAQFSCTKNCSQINSLILPQWVENECSFLKPIIPDNFIPMKLYRSLTWPPGRRERCCLWVSTWHLALAHKDRTVPFCAMEPRGVPARASWFDDHVWKTWALRSARKPCTAAYGLSGVRGAGGARPHCRRDPRQVLNSGLNKRVTIPRAITAKLKKKKKGCAA